MPGGPLAPLEFDAIYGHFGGKEILARSIERYAHAINGVYDVSAAHEGTGAA
jgi:hypothetical protein